MAAKRGGSRRSRKARSPRPPGSVSSPASASVLVATPGDDPGASAAQALTLARALETIEAAYAAWDELRAARALSRQHFRDERRRLDEQGELLVGAVRAAALGGGARPPPEGMAPDAVVPADDPAIARLLADSRERLDGAKARLTRDEEASSTALDRAEREVRALAHDRVEARTLRSPPRVRLLPRSLGERTRILHLERPSSDDAVCLFFALSGRIPSRYAAPFDDAVDDVLAAAPLVYAEEGVGEADVRPTPARLHELLQGLPEVWPVKGALVHVLADVAPPRLARWVTRGPVLEAELEDGAGFRNVLSREEAERITGALLALQLAGRLTIELGRG
jgi:hypothetical protein